MGSPFPGPCELEAFSFPDPSPLFPAEPRTSPAAVSLVRAFSQPQALGGASFSQAGCFGRCETLSDTLKCYLHISGFIFLNKSAVISKWSTRRGLHNINSLLFSPFLLVCSWGMALHWCLLLAAGLKQDARRNLEAAPSQFWSQGLDLDSGVALCPGLGEVMP